jgi:hypothetical protein
MQGMCVGMVDALDFLMSDLPAEDRSCPPSDASLKQTVQVVIKYIDERPERMNESFKKLAIEAYARRGLGGRIDGAMSSRVSTTVR